MRVKREGTGGGTHTEKKTGGGEENIKRKNWGDREGRFIWFFFLSSQSAFPGAERRRTTAGRKRRRRRKEGRKEGGMPPFFFFTGIASETTARRLGEDRGGSCDVKVGRQTSVMSAMLSILFFIFINPAARA